MFLGCFIVWYGITTLQRLLFQLTDQSMTFSISSVKSRQQVCSKCWQLAAGCYFDPENDCTENTSWVTDKGFKTKWWDNTCKLRDLKVVRCCHLTLGARSFSCAVSSFGKSLYSDLSFSCGFATHVINSASVMLKIQNTVVRYQDLELTNPYPPAPNFVP